MEPTPLDIINKILKNISTSEPLKTTEDKLNETINLTNEQSNQLNKHTEWLQFVGDEVIRKMKLRPYFFNIVSEMLSANYLHTGDCCFVLGNESPIDGKMKLFYLIKDNSVEVDNLRVFETMSGLKAIYIPDESINELRKILAENIKSIEDLKKDLESTDGGSVDEVQGENKASSIQFKRGSKASLPQLKDAEPYLAMDTKELFLGNGNSKISIMTHEEFQKENPNNTFIITLPISGWSQNGTVYSIPISSPFIKNGVKLNAAPGNETVFNELFQNGITSFCIKNNNGSAIVLLSGNKPNIVANIQIEAIPVQGISGVIYGEQVSLGSGGCVVSSSAPSNTKMLWVNSSTGVIKYYNGSAWVNTYGAYA